MENNNRISLLKFLPMSIFGAVMGLCGLCFSWRLADSLWHLNFKISEAIGAIAILLFIFLTITFIIKFRRKPAVLLAELNHPVSVSFYATFIISLLLIPGILRPYIPGLATTLWGIAAVGMLFFAWYVLRKWLDNQQPSENALPVWVIPIVGTLDVPIVGMHLPIYGIHEICMVFFGTGLIFTLILLPIIISRLMFQQALPQAMQPTLLLLTSPLALAFSDYESLAGIQDMFATVIFYFNLFLFAMLVSKLALLPKVCPFFVSWWSVSFPMVAVTIAAFHYAEHRPGVVHQVIAGALLITTTIVISFLSIQTLYRIFTGTFVTPAPKPVKL